MLATMVGRRRTFQVSDGIKRPKLRRNNYRNYKFLAKYFLQYFQIFSTFIHNESLLMKSYQFFKIYKRLDEEREKALLQQSMRKEKLRKVQLCFITGYLIKAFKMTINHFFFIRSSCSQDFFYFASSFAAQFSLFNIRMTQEISKGEIGNGRQLGVANYNIYSKNNFNRLVMNAT